MTGLPGPAWSEERAARHRFLVLGKEIGAVCAFGSCERRLRPFGPWRPGWCPQHAPDEVAIERAVAGEPPSRLLPHERVEAVRRLAARHLTDMEIAERLRVSTRTVERIRADHHIPSMFDRYVLPGGPVPKASNRLRLRKAS